MMCVCVCVRVYVYVYVLTGVWVWMDVCCIIDVLCVACSSTGCGPCIGTGFLPRSDTRRDPRGTPARCRRVL
jgi:hypothetical protein